jgi:hypothetical protein
MMDMSLIVGVLMGVMMVAMVGGMAWAFVRKLGRRKHGRHSEREGSDS